ncbi:MAG: S8 family serine peptidase [Actinomycetales bacterium]|nr:S8 family serine peptidase [Actinomycetales bacterium]
MKKKTTRGALVAVAGFGLTVGMLPAVTANAAPDVDRDAATISSQVEAELQSEGKADVWLSLGDKADLSAAYNMSWDDRGDYVYNTLTAHAEASQADLVAQLDRAGVTYETFWINNAIRVEDATADLVGDVAVDFGVSRISPTLTPELVDAEPTVVTEPNATTWGLDDIKAPQIWADYGTTGEDIVVGTFDTGMDVSHPALTAAYRGTTTGSDDYNWFDSRGTSDSPVDPHGHGTHVSGTMVGADGENQIGVAPGAQLIGATGCCVSDADVFETFEWFVAPTRVDGSDADPSMRPHIVNSSWGFTGYQDSDAALIALLDPALEGFDAAGIFGVFSAGNSNRPEDHEGDLGPCDNISNPAWHNGAHYVVGAYAEGRTIGDFSSRGPGQDGENGVDIAAPGVAVTSSVPGGGYESWNGTSMASPHVSGAVALLWSAHPELIGDQAATIAALDAAAVDQADPECGGPDSDNPTFGEGALDLVVLFESLEVPADAPEVTRAAGENRYETAQVVADLFGDDVDTVYLASGQNYPDAVTGSPAAAQGKLLGVMATPDGSPAPVLLAKSDLVPSATRAALADIAPENIVILGGETIIGAEVEAGLAEDYNVSRVAGADRYDTAANLAKLFTGTDKVYVAAGNDNAFSDALTASALAGTDNAPVLLTKPDAVPAVTAAALEELAPSEIIVIGGTATISDEVYAELGATGRLGGANKFETAAAISAEFGADVPLVYVASANDYPDALASSSLAGSQGAPVIVVKGTHDPADDKIPAVIEQALQTLSPEQVVIVGGPDAVDNTVTAWLEDPANWG